MSYVISKDTNNIIINVFNKKGYIEPGVETFPITNAEFETIRNSFTYALWEYVDGKIVQSANYDSLMDQKFNEGQAQLRQEAYAKYSDPIFMQYQRGTATKQDWEAKVDEIKALYPYKE